jgi:hypothetical protein
MWAFLTNYSWLPNNVESVDQLNIYVSAAQAISFMRMSVSCNDTIMHYTNIMG